MIGTKPTASLTYSESTSQGFSSQPWTITWERSPEDGKATLKLRLNLLCSGSGTSKSFIPYNIEEPVKGKWTGGNVPKLPPPYNGDFTGLPGSVAPSAEWSVQASIFQAKEVCWKPDVSLRVSKLRGQTGAQYFDSKRRWDKRPVLIKPDGPRLVYCLPPASTRSFRDSFTTFQIIIALLVVAVAFWQLHGN